ncbi:hypothetical protein SmJEL517_g00786 [Synchytrium microbalum]|uniref:SH3 domain-containing protein n=1 Tax=Synchytrium microbalum TaxID=1806994 RepID=A0A507C7I5_9FUNG|nr:uncharacterized protein SmJEL517_g00786 [Synchytrium microbalum]TPX37007.1 hypothetical protein SmJEL517_g00786 [Synchytrium microbalum]
MEKKPDLHAVIKALRTQHVSQIIKLQLKSDGDTELLENVRDYMKRRAEIEQDYFSRLEKLSKTYIQKKYRRIQTKNGTVERTSAEITADTQNGAAVPPATITESDDTMSVGTAISSAPMVARKADRLTPSVAFQAFQTMILETEKQAKERGLVSEKIMADVVEIIKEFNKDKVVATKKNLDFASKYHHGLATKIAYDKAAKDADAAKKKYDDVSRRPNSALNSLKNIMKGTDTEERLEKLKGKWKAALRRLADARNDYLVVLEGLNAQQSQYYNVDLPSLMRKLDGTYYQTFGKALTTLVNLEEGYATMLTGSVQITQQAVNKINRDKENEQFVKEFHPVFVADPKEFKFESSSNDNGTAICVDDVTKVVLGQRLARIMTRESELKSDLDRKEKELAGIVQMAQVYSENPAFGNAATPLESKLELETSIDLLRSEHTKITAQIELLTSLGVEALVPAVSTASLFVGGSSGTPGGVIIQDYEARASGEVTVKVDDNVVVLSSDLDGWLRIRKGDDVGMVPTSVVRVGDTNSSSHIKPKVAGSLQRLNDLGLHSSKSGLVDIPAVSVPPTGHMLHVAVDTRRQLRALYDFNGTDSSELSFKAGDIIEVLEINDAHSDAWWEGRVLATSKQGTFPVVFTSGWEAVATAMNEDNAAKGLSKNPKNDLANSAMSLSPASKPVAGGSAPPPPAAPSSTTKPGSPVKAEPQENTDGHPKAKALFSYEATCDGELTMDVGDIIVILNQDTGSEAWWEGQGPHGRGQFPVNYVELVNPDGSAIPGSVSSQLGTWGDLDKSLDQIIADKGLKTRKARALYSFEGNEGELTFNVGDVISVIDASNTDWWDGFVDDGGPCPKGAFPAAYVEMIREES